MKRGKRVRAVGPKLLKWLKEQGNLLLTGWMYFTRVPMPKFLSDRLNYSQSSLEKSAKYLPLFGILVGAASGGVFLLANLAFDNQALALVVSMIFSICATGALHEDGLIDYFDAFGGGWWSKEKILTIMKDSRVGSFGAIAIIMVVLLKFQALTIVSSGQMMMVLIAGHAFSRFAAASFIFSHDYVRANDQSYFKPMVKERMGTVDFIILAFIGMLPVIFVGNFILLCLLPVLWLVRTLFGVWFVGKIGGYTGDCLGATQQIVEVAFYLAVVAAFAHTM